MRRLFFMTNLCRNWPVCWGSKSAHFPCVCSGWVLCGISSKKYAKDAEFLRLLQDLLAYLFLKSLRNLLWALFLSRGDSGFRTQAPPALFSDSPVITGCTPGSSLSTIKLFSSYWLRLNALCTVFSGPWMSRSQVIRSVLHQRWIYVTSDWH